MSPKTLTSISILPFLAVLGCEADTNAPITLKNHITIENNTGCCGCDDDGVDWS